MQIPGYRIEREIGHGGMATVYRAEQLSLGRPVALKVMAAALAADRNFTERFVKEARTVAQLMHPNIVAVFDVGVVGHHHYLALEYVPGGDLKARLRGEALAPESALEITREIASALGYAHAKGFVHRDVKPENILFREDGTAVLTDFGIAKAAGSGTRMTGTGMSIGTPHYMSPEQARGQPVDHRADLYGLGVVLHEMLTGRVPYEAEDTLAVAYAHVNNPIPELPAALSAWQPILDHLLAKTPSDRYPDAAALITALDRLASGDPLARPVHATQVLPSQPAERPPIHPAPTGGGSGLLWGLGGAALAAVIAVGAWFYLDPGAPPRPIAGGGGGGSTALNLPAPPRDEAPTSFEAPTDAGQNLPLSRESLGVSADDPVAAREGAGTMSGSTVHLASEERFLQNSDGTFSDLKYGLVWMSCLVGQHWNGLDCLGSPNITDIDKAHDVARRHGRSGSIVEWRLPTIDELNTLTSCEPGNRAPFDSEGAGGGCSEGASGPRPPWSRWLTGPNAVEIWSSTPVVGTDRSYWYFSLPTGLIDSQRQLLRSVVLVRGINEEFPTIPHVPGLAAARLSAAELRDLYVAESLRALERQDFDRAQGHLARIVSSVPSEQHSDRIRSEIARTQGVLKAQQEELAERDRQRFDLPASERRINERFEVSGDGSLLVDHLNELIWLRCSLGQSWNGESCVGVPLRVGLDGAVEAVSLLGHAGFRDWRLPTIEELDSLVVCTSQAGRAAVDFELAEADDAGGECLGAFVRPTLSHEAFPMTPNGAFFAVDEGGDPWVLDFSSGYIFASFPVRSFDGHVRAVRHVRGPESPSASQPRPPVVAEIDRTEKIVQLLAAAAEDLAADRLLVPEESNAVSRYRQVLALSPNHPQALRGLEAVVARYGELIERNLRDGRYDRLHSLVERAESVDAAMASAAGLRARVDAALAEHQRKQAREAKVLPRAEIPVQTSRDLLANLANWQVMDGRWTQRDGFVEGFYTHDRGGRNDPQGSILLNERLGSMAGDWKMGVDFSYIQYPGRPYYYSHAAVVLWESARQKEQIYVGKGGENWRGDRQRSITVARQSYAPWTQVESREVSIEWEPRAWNRLELEKRGSRFIVYLNGARVHEFERRLSPDARLGLHVYGIAKVRNFTLTRVGATDSVSLR